MIRLRYATLTFTEWGCFTRFQDGAEVSAFPHETPHYFALSHRLGYADDILGFCQHHEFAHSFVEEKLHDRPSRVLWHLAHGQQLSGPDAAYEEWAAQNFQLFLRANQRPILSGVDWDILRKEALELLEQPDTDWLT